MSHEAADQAISKIVSRVFEEGEKKAKEEFKITFEKKPISLMWNKAEETWEVENFEQLIRGRISQTKEEVCQELLKEIEAIPATCIFNQGEIIEEGLISKKIVESIISQKIN